ncbi:flagellar biosynthetic protein FliR [Asticcacaulis tiandongensis]|uniref:flagellar biosynthetic protein FliR n=1 Tax=Asticcacaulis tiandongensis TaxID=2565365 RepID=UPI00319E8AE8
MVMIPLAPTPDFATEVTSFFGSSQTVWGAGLVFLRIGAIAMLLPGIGDQAVPPRVRLSFAFLFTLILLPVLRPLIPPLPPTMGAMAGLVIHELVIGLMLGMLIRVFIAALAIAGEIVSLQTALSFSQTANPAQAQPGTTLSTFLALLGLVLIYATGLHHLFIMAMADSYKIFSIVKPVMVGDASNLMVRTMSDTFLLAVQLTTPLLVFGLVFNIAAGFIGRIMPAFPIFFVAAPLSILFGLSIFAMGLGITGVVFIEHYEEFLRLLVRS